MRKKFIGVYALMAVLALGTTVTSCVDDNESASVTAIRDAKAKQLEALANLKNAEAEVQKAEALYKQAETAQIEQATAQEKAEFEAKIESLRAQYEAQLQLYKQQIAQNEALFRGTLYQNFVDANDKLKELEGDYIEAQLSLAEAKVGIKTAEATAKKTILQQDEIIASNNAKIKAYKELAANQHDELLAQKNELEVNLNAKDAEVSLKSAKQGELLVAFEAADDAYNGYEATSSDGTTLYVKPTLKTGQAIKDLRVSNSTVLSTEDVTPEDLEVYVSPTNKITKVSLKADVVASELRNLEDKLKGATDKLGTSNDKYNKDKPLNEQSWYAKFDYQKQETERLKKVYEDLLKDENATPSQISNAKGAWTIQEAIYLNYDKTWIDEYGAKQYGPLAWAIKTKDDAQETLDEFKANIALLDTNSEDYKAYIAAVDKTIEAVKAWNTAFVEWRLEVVAYEELEGTLEAVEDLLEANPDVDVLIAECEEAIANAEARKVVAGNVVGIVVEGWIPKRADSNYYQYLIDQNQVDGNGYPIDNNGNRVYVGSLLDNNNNVVWNEDDAAKVWGSKYEERNVEAFLKECELEVEHLKAEIEAQKLIVAQCKTELEAGINSGTVETPEETPAE